jgi:CspA family cold shock protein
MGGMVSHGIVREWDDDEGSGVIDSADTPGGCWVGFASIVMDGYRRLAAGDPVTFTAEPGPQDGYEYRAILLWPPGTEPGTPPAAAGNGPAGAYGSSLTIRWADGSVTRRSGDDPRPLRGPGQAGQ